MSIVLVTSVAGTWGQNGGTTSNIDTSGASFLVAHAASFASVSLVSDSKSNTWTPLTMHGSGNGFSRFWYVANPNVGTGHNFSVSGADTYPYFTVAAFSGVTTTSPFDQENGAASGGTGSLATGSVTPSENDELIVAGVCGSDGFVPAINSGFTILHAASVAGGVNMQGGLAYLIQTSAASVSPTWTSGGTGLLSASIAAFKSGGSPPPPPTTSTLPLFASLMARGR